MHKIGIITKITLFGHSLSRCPPTSVMCLLETDYKYTITQN